MESVEITSIGSVLVITLVVLQGLKSWFSTVPVLKSVPMVVLGIIVATGLSLLAYAAGYLQGPVGALIAKTVLAALGSNGLYAAITGSSTQTLKQVSSDTPTLPGIAQNERPGDPLKSLFVAATLSILLTGCEGCVSNTAGPMSPLAKVYQAKADYQILLNALADLRDAGLIPQSEVNKTRELRAATEMTLDLWELKARAGQPTDTEEAKYQQAAEVLRQLRLKFSKQPTSKPVGVAHERNSYCVAHPRTSRIGGWRSCCA